MGNLRGVALADLAVLVRAWIELLLVDAALRLLPWSWVLPRGGAAAVPRAPGRRTVAGRGLERIVRLTDIAARHHLYRMTCLRRSLVLQRLLQRHGIVCDVRLGVRRKACTLLAHAWVEHCGLPVGEGVDVGAHYAPVTLLRRPQVVR